MPASKPLLAVLVLVLGPLALAGDVSHGRFTGPSDREFQVLAAQWGTGHRWVDVTEKACELSTEAGLDVAAVRSHFGDPYPPTRLPGA